MDNVNMMLYHALRRADEAGVHDLVFDRRMEEWYAEFLEWAPEIFANPDGSMKDLFLPCEISPGQFSGEYAISGRTHTGEGFSLFAYDEDIECRDYPVGDERVSGWIRVTVLDTQGALALVQLPRQTMENGDAVTVRKNELREIRRRQKA